MLHASPLCVGIVHDPGSHTPHDHVYWALDGRDNHLVRCVCLLSPPYPTPYPTHRTVDSTRRP
eukprot:3278004-Pyramimonas_sp.AAC.1